MWKEGGRHRMVDEPQFRSYLMILSYHEDRGVAHCPALRLDSLHHTTGVLTMERLSSFVG